MIITHKLELSLSRTYFHGSKGVRAIEVLLYTCLNHREGLSTSNGAEMKRSDALLKEQ